MTNFQNNIVFDLSKKYVFETFDFKNKSPEDFADYYQEIYRKIENLLKNKKTIKQPKKF